MSLSSHFQEAGGIKSSNMLKNLGLVLLGFIGLIAIVVILLLMRMPITKCAPIAKLYNLISNKIFFNSILRSMI